MSNEISSEHIASATNSLLPIDRLNPDVMSLIFQDIIEEEADHLMRRSGGYGPFPRAGLKLALVCKNWKNIIHSTSSLWPIIDVNLTNSFDQEQSRCERLAERSRNVPVDLYLINLHSEDTWCIQSRYRHNSDCCCKGDVIRVNLTHIPNVRRLHITCDNPMDLRIFSPKSLHTFRDLTALYLGEADSSAETINVRYDLSLLLSDISGLKSLYIHRIKAYILPDASTDCILLPKLLNLVLSTQHVNQGILSHVAQFLSHAPRIERLELSGFNHKDVPSATLPIVCLPYLRQLRTTGFGAVECLFSEGRIKIPRLVEFDLEERIPTRVQVLLSYDPVYRDKRIQQFFASNRSIRKLRLSIKHLHQPSIESFDSSSVEDLELQHDPTGDATSSSLIPWHSDLVNPKKGSPDFPFPNLRLLTLDTSLIADTGDLLDELAIARCIPVDENGITVKGCKAIEALIIKSDPTENPYSFSVSSCTIRHAEIREISNSWYELRWFYHPGQTF